jgi:large subunit ribosomal protein L19
VIEFLPDMQQLIEEVNAKFTKHQVVDVRSGDVVRVHQKIKEGNKERVQVFEGLVIRTRRKGSSTSTITVRRIASGVGVEKTFMLHSPLVVKVEVIKRSKVRRKYLSYMRQRSGKSARLAGVAFDKEAVNTIEEQQNVDAGLEKDADIEEIEAAEKPEKVEAEKKPDELKDKPDEADKEESTTENDNPADTAGDTASSEDASEAELSKEEKAKLKKEKAKAFQESQEKK